jgi:hypothetical protein
MNPEKNTIYIIPFSDESIHGRQYAAVDIHLRILATHFCSDKHWAMQDLGTKSRLHFYQSMHYAGVLPELVYIDEDNPLFDSIFLGVYEKALMSEEIKQQIGRHRG